MDMPKYFQYKATKSLWENTIYTIPWQKMEKFLYGCRTYIEHLGSNDTEHYHNFEMLSIINSIEILILDIYIWASVLISINMFLCQNDDLKI